MTVNKVKLFEHQLKALELTKDKHRVAYYLEYSQINLSQSHFK